MKLNNTEDKLIIELVHDIQLTLSQENWKLIFQFDKLIKAISKEASFEELIERKEFNNFTKLLEWIKISAMENWIILNII
jgi:hypothetical protein